MCYTYDNNGNILTKDVNGERTEYRYQEGSDRLVSFGTETFSYDAVGNPVVYRGMACEWEKGRQLKTVCDGTNKVEYEYNAFGLRTAKKVYTPETAAEPAETTTYVYENGQLLRQVTGSEVIDFLYGAGGIIGIRINTANYMYRKNVFGDVTELYSESGEVVGRYSYSAYGECVVEQDTGGIATKNPIRYRGYYYDESLSMYYLKSRYYDPEIGRFMTIDSVTYISASINGTNLYAYCGCNPVMRTDPNGCDWREDALRVIGGFFLVSTGLGLLVGMLPAFFMPGSGFIMQAGFSLFMYGGFMIASVFDDNIKKDMEAIGWNPFNSDENLVLSSQKVSFYKGMPTVWMNKNEGRSGSFLGIWLYGENDVNTIRHEWGHGIQQGIMGWGKFLLMIGLPSWQRWGGNHWQGLQNYYRRPWEAMADMFGGAGSRQNYRATTAEDRAIAIWYTVIATLFGPLAFVFLI